MLLDCFMNRQCVTNNIFKKQAANLSRIFKCYSHSWNNLKFSMIISQKTEGQESVLNSIGARVIEITAYLRGK